jgi:hypothetical protein
MSAASADCSGVLFSSDVICASKAGISAGGTSMVSMKVMLPSSSRRREAAALSVMSEIETWVALTSKLDAVASITACCAVASNDSS